MSRLRQDGVAGNLTDSHTPDGLDEIEANVGEIHGADDIEDLTDTDSNEQALDESTLLGIED